MPEGLGPLTVGGLPDRFLADYVPAKLKPETAKGYTRVIKNILKPRLGHLAIGDIATKDVAEAYHALRATPTQASLAVRILSSAMSQAEEWGLRPAGSNPARIRLKAPRRRERLFSDAEVARLRKSIDVLEAQHKIHPSAALALRLLFATGCRAGEILDLEWSLVDLEENWLRWPDSKTGFLEKPITNETRALLKRASRIVGVRWVCPSANSLRMSVETLEAAFERAMEAANVPANENATLHLVRHWFASKTYSDKSIALPQQMKIVGHKAVATAMRYAHVEREEVAKAAQGAARRRTRAVSDAAKRAAKSNVVALRR